MSEAFIEDKDDKKFLAIMEAIKNALPDLSRDMQSALRIFLPEVRNIRDAQYLVERMKDPIKWMYPKVSVDTFLDSKKYFWWFWINVFPKVRQICKEIIEGDFREAIEIAGIWSWKSFSSAVIACYTVHHLLCLRNAHWNYWLSRDKNISVLNMGISATQAKWIVFTSLRTFISESPFFQQFNPKVLSMTIEFPDQKIVMNSGNSKANTALGSNLFCAILDEADFYQDTEGRAVAKDIYDALSSRIASRFKNNGLLLMISSPKYVWWFISKRLEESRKTDENWKLLFPHVYGIQLPTWKVQFLWDRNVDKDGNPIEYFYFNPRLSEIIEDDKLEEQLELRKVNYIDDPEFDDTYDLWEIPMYLKPKFMQNPEQSKRDYWATPSLALEWFFPNASFIKECYNLERENPLKTPGKYEFIERPLRVPYYIHIDIGFNRNGKGDHTGFAMWHFGWWINDEATGETRMKFVIDLVERIAVSEGNDEINVSDIRNRIYDLKAMWFNVALVTLDWYQSKDTMQILKKKWIKADYLSVDRTIDPYNILKAAFREKRIDLPYYKPLEDELLTLELIRGIKVDHPINWSKDVADAVAGVVANINEYTHSGDLWVRNSMSNMTEKEKYDLAMAKKAKEYAMLQKMVDRQDEIMNARGL